MNYKRNAYVWNEDAMTNTHKNEFQRHEHSIYPKFHHSSYGNCETQTYPTHKVSNRPRWKQNPSTKKKQQNDYHIHPQKKKFKKNPGVTIFTWVRKGPATETGVVDAAPCGGVVMECAPTTTEEDDDCIAHIATAVAISCCKLRLQNTHNKTHTLFHWSQWSLHQMLCHLKSLVQTSWVKLWWW
jgi:hypothetical protein